MSRKSFKQLVSMIKDHAVFQSKSRGRKQERVEHQLQVLLAFLGTEGDGASNRKLRNTFKKGCGSAEAHKNRCITAIRSLRDQFYYWPDADECKQIAKRIEDKYVFPNCVGFADGTLLPLRHRPESKDAPDYSGRKFGYSLSTLVVCDDTRKIRYYLSGWPGSAHDNRIFRNSMLYQKSGEYFGRKQYVLGDSAYQSTPFMVSAYKKPPNGDMDDLDALLNDALSKPRVISEHCNGILKGRFPHINSIRVKITDDPKSLRKILRLIDVCVILHNFLIEQNDNVPKEWIVEDDDSDESVECSTVPNDHRRQQIRAHIADNYVPR